MVHSRKGCFILPMDRKLACAVEIVLVLEQAAALRTLLRSLTSIMVVRQHGAPASAAASEVQSARTPMSGSIVVVFHLVLNAHV